MRRQKVDPGARWAWLPALLTAIIAGGASYKLATGEQWVSVVLVIGVALAGLVEWYMVRQRSADAQFAADRMLTVFMVAMLVIVLLVGV